MRANAKTIAIALLALVAIPIAAANASFELGTENGWKTWQVEAIADAPEMCCFKWRNGQTSKQGCHLDRKQGGFVSHSGKSSPGSIVQVFALLEEGSVQQLRALSGSCGVTANTEIVDLGRVNSDESVSLLQTLLSSNEEMASDVIAAIAVHSGNDATAALLEVAKNDKVPDLREAAIFWMGQSRIDETATALKDFALKDRDPDIREHAAFAYAQSSADDASELLMQQGKTDSDPDVRAQAWFWLAETGAPESEAAIGRALRNDPDDDVREEAVFALSQLPDDRAVPALANVLEDKTLHKDIREQALFWLAQAESEKAFEYIDRLLSNN